MISRRACCRANQKDSEHRGVSEDGVLQNLREHAQARRLVTNAKQPSDEESFVMRRGEMAWCPDLQEIRLSCNLGGTA